MKQGAGVDRSRCDIVDRFVLHASVAPDALAVTDDELSVTYAQLDSRSDAVCERLRSLGIGRDAVVGVCVDRSVVQVVAALGVMKSGAAFVPLDPAQPRERVALMLEEGGVGTVLVRDDATTSGLPSGVRTVRLRDDGSCDAAPASPAATVRPDDPAYVIFTSGSTGPPKGVEITHAALANLAAWHRSAFAVEPSDRASHIAAVGFDAAVWEVWPYLTAGATVVIAADLVARDPRALADWLASRRITIAFVATPLAERMLDFDYPAGGALRIMLTGGDVLHRYPPSSLPFALYNNYGPTEATVVATSGRIDPAGADDSGLPSIGRPIDGVELCIVDPTGTLREDGCEGEIAIGGAGLARGYRGRPGLTAEKFVWLSIDGSSPRRVYRTGDLGRRRRDGRIDFLGRLDDQVKIRGLRIEPREIETAANAHEDVFESAVVVSGLDTGDPALIAYVVPKRGRTIEPARIRRFLETRIPASMLPAIVEVAALPLTPNGKVDRADLVARDYVRTSDDDRFVEPRTAVERELAEIVALLLRRDRVSVEGDFFRLGGHSLLGTQLISRIRDAFGVAISLRDLFESPTIAAIAAEVDVRRRANGEAAAPVA